MAGGTILGGETSEVYAVARQIAVEHGLELADVGRSYAFASRRDTFGALILASTLGIMRSLERSTQGAVPAD